MDVFLNSEILINELSDLDISKSLNLEAAWARNGHSLQAEHPDFLVHIGRGESALSVHDRSQYEVAGARRESSPAGVVGGRGMAFDAVADGRGHSERISVLSLEDDPMPRTNVHYALLVQVLMSELVQVARVHTVLSQGLHRPMRRFEVNAQDWKQKCVDYSNSYQFYFQMIYAEKQVLLKSYSSCWEADDIMPLIKS